MNRQQAVQHALKQLAARPKASTTTTPRPTPRYRKGQYLKLKEAGLCVY